MNKWAYIENIVIFICMAALIYFGHYWSLLFLLGINSGRSK